MPQLASVGRLKNSRKRTTPPPSIIGSPTWTDNANGTATVTWTTDIATDSLVQYGYDAAYLEFSGSVAGPNTSHSVVVTEANGTYHFVVTNAAGAFESTDATGAITGASDSTTNYTQADLAGYFFGFFDDVTGGQRNWLSQYTLLAFWARGSSVSLRCSAGATQPFAVSVDGGAQTSPVTTGSNPNMIAVLSSGLSDAWHLYQIRSNGAYDPDNARTALTGTVISVTGGRPRIAQRTLGGNGYHVTDPSLPGQAIYPTVAALGGNYLPAYRMVDALIPSGRASYSYGGSVVIRAKCTDLWVYTAENRCRYAVDGGTWNSVTFDSDLDGSRFWKLVATGLDGTAFHDYVVASGRSFGDAGTMRPLQGIMAGNTAAAVTYETPTERTTFIQFGDSITLAQEGGLYTGNGDTYIAAQAAGGLAMMSGRGGAVVDDLRLDLPLMLDGRWPVTDVAVLAIGFNDSAASGNEAAFKADYEDVITQLLNYGHTKIVCRTPVPNSGSGNRETWISDIVTGRANPNITLLNMSSIGAVATSDGTHPTAAGFVTIAAHEQSTYDALA